MLQQLLITRNTDAPHRRTLSRCATPARPCFTSSTPPQPARFGLPHPAKTKPANATPHQTQEAKQEPTLKAAPLRAGKEAQSRASFAARPSAQEKKGSGLRPLRGAALHPKRTKEGKLQTGPASRAQPSAPNHQTQAPDCCRCAAAALRLHTKHPTHHHP